jgi:HEAT repeats/PBS lyase HEAT-like repeat
VSVAGRFVGFVLGSRRSGAARATLAFPEATLVACAIGLGCLTLPYARAADPSPAASADIAVTVADGRLSVRVEEVPLETVLEAFAAQAGVAITIQGDPGTVSAQAFTDLPLDVGIRRLAGERRLLMVFARADDRGRPGRLQQIRIYGDPPSDNLARPREPLTRTLGKLTEEPTASAPEPPSYQELAAKDKGVRLAAICGLARQQDEAAIEVLSALLAHDPNATIRRIAATALGNIGGDAGAAALKAALLDQNVEVRIQAMRGLHAIDPEAATAPLGELALDDADPGLRRQAVHLLATLRSDEARATVELAASDPDDTVRQAAEEALTRPRRWR